MPALPETPPCKRALYGIGLSLFGLIFTATLVTLGSLTPIQSVLPFIILSLVLPVALAAFWDKIWGLDLDRGLPFSRVKDGFSMFTSLAGFAVAQSVALTAVAKDEDSTLVITIYLFTVIVTAVWTWCMLRRVREEDIAGVPTTVRAFDKPSIDYGRGALIWTAIVAGIMFLLWAKGLLPNQTTRVAYDGGDDNLRAEPSALQSFDWTTLKQLGGEQYERQSLDKWIEWMKRGEMLRNEVRKQSQVETKEPMLWINLRAWADAANRQPERWIVLLQATDFKKRYKPFKVEITYDDENLQIKERVCFLVRRDGDSIRPALRELQFPLNNKLEYTDAFTVPNADPGEYLFLIGRLVGKPRLKNTGSKGSGGREAQEAEVDEHGNPVFFAVPADRRQWGVSFKVSK